MQRITAWATDFLAHDADCVCQGHSCILAILPSVNIERIFLIFSMKRTMPIDNQEDLRVNLHVDMWSELKAA